jgi:hypothetical protein
MRKGRNVDNETWEMIQRHKDAAQSRNAAKLHTFVR